MILFPVAILLLLLGLWLSAFFSGSETGFYRVSFLRLSIEAHAGNRAASRALWFARRPAAFVATTLVGNNVANYLTTFAIVLGLTSLMDNGNPGPFWEIATTMACAPIIFLFGELVPKKLYLQAPLKLLQRNARLFRLFYYLFAPISFPLVLVSRCFQQFAPREERAMTLVLGRKRLVQVLEEGHEQGLLSDVQDRLVNGLFQTASVPVDALVLPSSRVRGVSESATRDSVLEHARRNGLSEVAVYSDSTPGKWTGYLRTVDLATRDTTPSAVVNELPQLPRGTSRLKVLLALNEARAPLGLICNGNDSLGLISRRKLIEQLIRPRADA